jgi:hypothetical protein
MGWTSPLQCLLLAQTYTISLQLGQLTHLLRIAIYHPIMRIVVSMEVSYWFLIATTRSVFVFRQQYLMVYSSAITIGTHLIHYFTAWTPHSSLNSFLWSHKENSCEEYEGFLTVSFTHHLISFCLPTAIHDTPPLCNHYCNKYITFFYSLDTSLIY